MTIQDVYRQWMEQDHLKAEAQKKAAEAPEASSTSALAPHSPIAPAARKKVGYDRVMELLDATADRSNNARAWRAFSARQDQAEDAGLLLDAERMFRRTGVAMPRNIAAREEAVARQSKRSADAISGPGRRSIPRDAVGRGQLNPRSAAGSATSRAQGATKTSPTQLGTTATVPHRPQGLGRSGTWISS